MFFLFSDWRLADYCCVASGILCAFTRYEHSPPSAWVGLDHGSVAGPDRLCFGREERVASGVD